MNTDNPHAINPNFVSPSALSQAQAVTLNVGDALKAMNGNASDIRSIADEVCADLKVAIKTKMAAYGQRFFQEGPKSQGAVVTGCANALGHMLAGLAYTIRGMEVPDEETWNAGLLVNNFARHLPEVYPIRPKGEAKSKPSSVVSDSATTPPTDGQPRPSPAPGPIMPPLMSPRPRPTHETENTFSISR